MLFNHLLLAHGIKPTSVLLLRHSGGTSPRRRPWHLWYRDRTAFDEFQSTQNSLKNGLFRGRSIWAGFIGNSSPQQTRFIGLWDSAFVETRQPDGTSRCPLSGEPLGNGKPYDSFRLRLRPELQSFVGILDVAWPQDSKISWKRAADRLDLRCLNLENGSHELERAEINGPADTERLVQALARIGQGPFRDKLFAEFGERCPVSGTDDKAVLRASHIKRWADCTDEPSARVNPANGLLLAAHIDALFEAGRISFGDKGELLISEALTPANRERLLPQPNVVIPLSPERARFLQFHRSRHGFSSVRPISRHPIRVR